MARYKDASCRLCRREGQKLFLKGARCYEDKCAVNRRSGVPGQHGQLKKKMSEYGQQLREKQKAKRFYGILESQFRKYFDMARRSPGITGENLLFILESRIDNVVYRLGLGSSRAEARQLVNHGHFRVNGKKVNIPSYLLNEGDVITIKDSSRTLDRFKEIVEANEGKTLPSWLEFDPENMTGRVMTKPTREDIDIEIAEHLIVELYSK
jgi:small subunit ribosomal protein S4